MAILIVFEMTLDYEFVLPAMLASVVAYYVASGIHPESIYAESLKRQKPAASHEIGDNAPRLPGSE